MLIITIIIASLTLIERKILALVQRRVGPFYIGYKGRLQYLADALKLFLKEISIPYKINNFFYTFFPSLLAFFSYTLWINSLWGVNVIIIEIEYNIILFIIISFFFNFCILLTGYFSKNKYATISSYRICLNLISLEFLLNLFFFNLFIFSESFNYYYFILIQQNLWFGSVFFLFLGLFFCIFLIETNRSPFDLIEAESELIAGYTSEFGGFYFALYYLGEYFHLFFFSYIFTLLIFGGWNIFNLFSTNLTFFEC